MYCPKCGTENDDSSSCCKACGSALPLYCQSCGCINEIGAQTCVQCDRPLQRPADTSPGPPVFVYTPPQPVSVPNYLVPAILVTAFCCMPFGIAAMVFAAQANTKAALGDFRGAMAAASAALMWCWISFGATVVGTILYISIFGIKGLLSGESLR